MSLASVFIYGIAKYVAYALWCYAGLRLFARHATARSALGLGALRWLIGLAFGLGVFVAVGSINETQVAGRYFAIYTPLRIVEWAILLALLARTERPNTIPAVAWIVGGVAVSFATDLVSPDGLAGRFCIGRCLC